MEWLITLGILTLLAILPLGVSVLYHENGPLVRLIAGPVRLTLFPKKKKDKKEKPKKEKPEKEVKTGGQKGKVSPKKGGSFADFMPLVQLALNFLGDFRRKLRVKRLEMKLIMAGGDPCDLAINYGKAWAAVGNLMPHLENLFVIKKRNVEVECDFTANETLIFLHLDITITLGRLLALVVVYGIRAVKEFLNLTNQRKGGAKQ